VFAITYWYQLFLILTLSLLYTGCAFTSTVNSDDLAQLKAGMPMNETRDRIAAKATYRLDYLLDGHYYRIETYHTSDTAEYYDYLFRDGVLVHAASTIGRISKIRKCTRSPLEPGMDVNACLQEYTDNLMRQESVWNDSSFHEPNKVNLDERKKETIELVGGIVALSPVVVPVATVMLPFVAIGKISDASINRPQVKLGDKYAEIGHIVNNSTVVVRFLDDTQRTGTVFVPRKGMFKFAASAFGFQDGIVNWIAADIKYYGYCQGQGFLKEDVCGF